MSSRAGKSSRSPGAGGEEEIFGDVEDGGRTGAILVVAGLDKEVSVDEVADYGVGVHAAGGVDAGAGEGTQVEDTREDLVGRARERGRAGLLAEALDGDGAEGVRRELKPTGDLPEHYSGGRG